MGFVDGVVLLQGRFLSGFVMGFFVRGFNVALSFLVMLRLFLMYLSNHDTFFRRLWLALFLVVVHRLFNNFAFLLMMFHFFGMLMRFLG